MTRLEKFGPVPLKKDIYEWIRSNSDATAMATYKS